MSYALITRIQDTTCVVFGINREDLLSHRRTQNLAHARIIAMAITRQITKASLPTIGREFQRDHTTVVHAVERAVVLLQRYPDYREKRTEIIGAVLPKPVEAAAD